MSLASEVREIAERAERQRAGSLAALGAELRRRDPAVVVTCARGSSDHAATYGKYLLETRGDQLVASIGPSIASRYHRRPRAFRDAVLIVISQSGASPDLLELATTAREGGAFVVGITNSPSAPLVALCHELVPIDAGEEHAIAATKTFVLSAYALLRLAAAWSGDAELVGAVDRAPDVFGEALALDWQAPLVDTFGEATNGFVVGRGLGLGIAAELALKLKETCRLHAEAFSTAEVLHGPVALVKTGFPVLALHQRDETGEDVVQTVAKLRGYGARVLSTLELPGALEDPILTPLCHAIATYQALPAIAAMRGVDADRPAHLVKVTETR